MRLSRPFGLFLLNPCRDVRLNLRPFYSFRARGMRDAGRLHELSGLNLIRIRFPRATVGNSDRQKDQQVSTIERKVNATNTARSPTGS